MASPPLADDGATSSRQMSTVALQHEQQRTRKSSHDGRKKSAAFVALSAHRSTAVYKRESRFQHHDKECHVFFTCTPRSSNCDAHTHDATFDGLVGREDRVHCWTYKNGDARCAVQIAEDLSECLNAIDDSRYKIEKKHKCMNVRNDLHFVSKCCTLTPDSDRLARHAKHEKA